METQLEDFVFDVKFRVLRFSATFINPRSDAVTMQNTGNAPVTFNSITATAPFQLSHDCPASLAPSATEVTIYNQGFALVKETRGNERRRWCRDFNCDGRLTTREISVEELKRVKALVGGLL